MQIALQSGGDDGLVVPGGRRDEHAIQLLLGEHLLVVRVRLDARVLGQHVEDVGGGVAHRHELHFGVGIDHGLMGQTHLSQPDDSCFKH